MTYRCNNCGGPVELEWDNGAEYPETRVEMYECIECDNQQKQVLTA